MKKKMIYIAPAVEFSDIEPDLILAGSDMEQGDGDNPTEGEAKESSGFVFDQDFQYDIDDSNQ